MEGDLESSLTALSNLLLVHVVPLFNIPPGKRPVLVGSSLLVELNGVRYFVSARHVVDWITERGGLHYYIDRRSLHKLVGTVVRTAPTRDYGGLDPFDVAIVRLPADARLPKGEAWKVPIQQEALRPGETRRTSKQYVVVGFPKSRSKANPHSRQLKSEPAAFRIVAAEPAAYEYLGLSDATHIVLNLDVDRMNFPDGSIRAVPDPHGMSGAPLWVLFDEVGENNPRITPVVGTVIEYHKERKLLVATDIGVALALIQKSAA
jgi:hypothetical protein